MIRISLATVKQTTPRIRNRPRFDRDADGLDAILVIIPVDATAALLERLPENERWLTAIGRRPAPGSVHVTTLSNPRQTRAIAGVLPAGASSFDLLSLAGRMLKQLDQSLGTRAGSISALGLAAPRPATAGAPPGADGAALAALLGATLAHSFALPSFRKPDPDARPLQRIDVLGEVPDLARLRAEAYGNNLARWLTALPPNKLTAATYRRLLGEAAREHDLSLRWLDEAALRRLGCGAFLAVSAGNAKRTAGIAHLRYRPPRLKRRAAPDVALVGKGILFDTGGTNLKGHRGMLDMHTDMAGSAVALGVLCALAKLRAPLAVDCWLAISENRTGPDAYVPQDVVTAANGLTIQVIHTDAEGRMALADTLVLAGRTAPRLMIDYATLTGACVTALTDRMSGVFVNRPELTPAVMAAGTVSGERVWPFPFEADFDADLDSKVADILQCTEDSKGDHILAARFLGRFVPEGTPWVHMDLSSATRSGGLAHVNTTITGFGVRYTLELLRNGVEPLLHGAGS